MSKPRFFGVMCPLWGKPMDGEALDLLNEFQTKMMSDKPTNLENDNYWTDKYGDKTFRKTKQPEKQDWKEKFEEWLNSESLYHLRMSESDRLFIRRHVDHYFIQPLQQSNASLKAENERLMGLLREVCVRANVIFPETVEGLEQFDEQFANQFDLHLNLSATLGLGEVDAGSIKDNQERLLKFQAGVRQPDEIERLKKFLRILQENYQVQIAGFYNIDKTESDKEKRKVVIKEYQDLIAIFKQQNNLP